MFDKHTLRAFLWAATAFLVVMFLGPRIFPPPQPAPPPDSTAGGPALPPGESGIAPAGPIQEGSAGAALGASARGGFEAAEAESVQTLEIGADPGAAADADDPEKRTPSPYRMHVVLSNVGASVEEVTLPDHRESLHGDELYKLLAPVNVGGLTVRSLAVLKINIDETDVVLGDKRWHAAAVEVEGGQAVRFTLDITERGEPALRLTRTYTLRRQPPDSLRHDLGIDLSVENIGSRARRVIVEYGSGVGIRQVFTRADGRVVDVGVTSGDSVAGQRHRFADMGKAGPTGLVLFDSEGSVTSRLAWAAVENEYFTVTVAPLPRDPSAGEARYVRLVTGYEADPLGGHPNSTTVRFTSRLETVAPQGVLRYPAEAYLGEKSTAAFKKVPEYKARNYYYQIAQGYGWCTFTWLVDFMIWLLNFLHAVVRDYGIALIILVVMVRTILHPITKMGQVNMVRMQKQMGLLGPRMEEIKKKYPNDKVRQQQETMKVYSEAGINPMGQMLTCLPMMFQLPIWAALYMSLSNNILMRHQPFAWSWPHDLTAPDALWSFSPVNLPLMGAISSFNLLPFILAGAMYLQQKMMPKPTPPPNQTKQQKDQAEMMQKMMPVMSIMMLFIFYNAPSGLTLYIMASTIFGTVEQHRIRKHIKEQEAAGVFDRKPRGSNGPGPKSFLRTRAGGFFSRLQKLVEDAQKRQPARKPKRS